MLAVVNRNALIWYLLSPGLILVGVMSSVLFYMRDDQGNVILILCVLFSLFVRLVTIFSFSKGRWRWIMIAFFASIIEYTFIMFLLFIFFVPTFA